MADKRNSGMTEIASTVARSERWEGCCGLNLQKQAGSDIEMSFCGRSIRRNILTLPQSEEKLLRWASKARSGKQPRWTAKLLRVMP